MYIILERYSPDVLPQDNPCLPSLEMYPCIRRTSPWAEAEYSNKVEITSAQNNIYINKRDNQSMESSKIKKFQKRTHYT